MASQPNHCLIHFAGEIGKLTRFTEHSYRQVLEYSERWKSLDGEHRRVAERACLDEKEWHNNSAAGYHRGCY